MIEMSHKLFKRVVKATIMFLIVYVASSMAGLDLSELNVIFYTIVILLIGVFYGIMTAYEMPSEEFMKTILEEEKEDI